MQQEWSGRSVLALGTHVALLAAVQISSQVAECNSDDTTTGICSNKFVLF